MLTQDYLKTILEYQHLTGIFIWKIRPAMSVLEGSIAGSITGTPNYIYITIKGKPYAAHRLAFLYMTGNIPKFIDHKDTNKLNNKWDNLREASSVENQANKPVSVTNKLGIKGVCWNTRESRFEAYVQKKGHKKQTKKFKTLEEAVAWVQEARELLHGDFANHG